MLKNGRILQESDGEEEGSDTAEAEYDETHEPGLAGDLVVHFCLDAGLAARAPHVRGVSAQHGPVGAHHYRHSRCCIS